MPGWTTPTTWTSGAATSAAMNAQIRDNLTALNGYVLKTADESVTSSTTLQNDDHLLYAIPAIGTYAFDLYLWALSAANAAGDIAVAFSFPAGTLHFQGQGPDPALASGSVQTGEWKANLSATSGTTVISYGLSTNLVGIHVHGLLAATATGTLQTMWAQVASNASASTVKAGSHLIVRQVA
jgi:hypothetical protein